MSIEDVQRISAAAVEAGRAAIGGDASGFAIVVVVQQLSLDTGGGIPANVGTNITGPNMAADTEKVLQTGLRAVRERRGGLS